MAATGIETSINALTAILDEMVDNSKIIAAVDKIIGDILGLLVDLILLPFLPIIIYALMGVLQGVLWFGKLWGDAVNGVFKDVSKGLSDLKDALAKGIDGLIKLSIAFVDDVASVAWAILKWFYNAGKWTGKVSMEVGASFGGVVGDILMWFYNAGKWTGKASFELGASFGGWVGDVLNWFYNAGKWTAKASIDIGATFGGWVGDVLRWLSSFNNGVIKLTMDIVGSATSAATTSGGDVLGALKNIPGLGWLDTGGTVSQTGLAVVHAGETVVPNGAGGNTYNFYGYDDVSLQSKVKNILRQQGSQYQL
jgi:hypothetical protein